MGPTDLRMVLRGADESDLPAIEEIYDHYVRTSTCTYQYEPSPPGERLAWFREHDAAHPVTVAATPSGNIVGWGALSMFRARAGYRFTVEDTVYIRHDMLGRGIGKSILGDLVERARRLGHHTILAGVSAEQGPSIALHRAFGFTEVARFREVGFKHDTWLDVLFMQRMLR